MKRFAFVVSLLCLFTTLSLGATKPKVVDAYGKLPLSFEANQGQSDARVKFISRGRGYTLFLTGSAEAVLALSKSQPHAKTELVQARLIDREKPVSTVVRMKLIGASASPHVEALKELPGKANYFIGNDPKKWRTDVPIYAKVKYHAVYPGVDLVYYGNQRKLEHDFIVAPAADPAAIRLRLEGARKLSLDAQGDLILATKDGEIRFQKPVVYQEMGGVRQEIGGGYVLKGKNEVGFEVATYDVTKPLVIDPTLVYSTYLGGSYFDFVSGIAVDSLGSAYVTGSTLSRDFPTTPGAFQTAKGGGYDVFVTKLNADGSGLVYSTYLGSSEDFGVGIAVDSGGSAYVTGYAFNNGQDSASFPTTTGAFQTASVAGNHAFVTKLNAAGSGLVYSTYLGGSSDDFGGGIAVDSAGSAYVMGYTGSTNFPTTPGAFQTSNASGGCCDAFVTKLNVAGSGLVYSTYLGGGDYDVGAGIAVDSAGSAYVTGYTQSTNFPTTPGAFQSAKAGGAAQDAFVTKLNADGSGLVYSTYLGGSGADFGSYIAVDSLGSAYVTGSTGSTDFPTTTGAYQTTFGGGGDAFVTKLNAAGSGLVYSTYLGGSGGDGGSGIAVDSLGSAYVTGGAGSNFPTTTGAYQTTFGGGGDAFVTKLNAAGSGLVYSTYLGGSGGDSGSGIAVDSLGSAYVTGFTNSTNFPTTTGAFQTAGGYFDAFVTKIGNSAQNVNGNLTVSSGQTYTFESGKITGNVTMSGGTLVLYNTAIGGNLQMSGGNLSMSGGSVGNDVQISGGELSRSVRRSPSGET